MRRVQRWQVKFILPALGLLGAYAGAGLGLLIVGRAASYYKAIPIPGALALAAGLGAMLGVERLIGENAGHVDELRVLKYWTVTASALLCAGWFLERAVAVILPDFLTHAALLASGILAVWVDEPK
jgi:hypothetical protein